MSRWYSHHLHPVGLTLAPLWPLWRAVARSRRFRARIHPDPPTQVTALLRQIAKCPARQADRQVLDGMIDYDELAKRSLATHWADLSTPSARISPSSQALGSAQLREQHQKHSRLPARLPRRRARARRGSRSHARQLHDRSARRAVAIDYRSLASTGTLESPRHRDRRVEPGEQLQEPVSPRHPEGWLRGPAQAHEREARQGPGGLGECKRRGVARLRHRWRMAWRRFFNRQGAKAAKILGGNR